LEQSDGAVPGVVSGSFNLRNAVPQEERSIEKATAREATLPDPPASQILGKSELAQPIAEQSTEYQDRPHELNP